MTVSLLDSAATGSCPRCSVVVVSYNSARDLPACLDSLMGQSLYRDAQMEIIVVDNGSTDGTVMIVHEQYPDVVLIQADENLGYAGGNNIGFRTSRGEYVGVMNPDCVADSHCFEHLCAALDREPGYALASPKAILSQEPALIDTCGLGVDASGYGVTMGHREPANWWTVGGSVPSVSGSCFVGRRHVIEETDGFDPQFFLYVEEVDLSLRARLLGYGVYFEPLAMLWHDHELASDPRKFYYLERNRVQLLFKTLSGRSLFCLAPGLLLNEVSVWLYAAMSGRGYLRAKASSIVWLARHRHDLYRRRRAVQAARRITDQDILRQMSPRMPLSKLQRNVMARAVNRMLYVVNWVCLATAGILSTGFTNWTRR